jgi:hypothetical protein
MKTPIVYRLPSDDPAPCSTALLSVWSKEASEMACRIVLHSVVDDKQLLVLLPLTPNLLLTVLLLALAAARNWNYKCRQMLRRAESLNQTDPKRKVRVVADANWAGILPHPILLVNMYGSGVFYGMAIARLLKNRDCPHCLLASLAIAISKTRDNVSLSSRIALFLTVKAALGEVSGVGGFW